MNPLIVLGMALVALIVISLGWREASRIIRYLALPGWQICWIALVREEQDSNSFREAPYCYGYETRC